MNRGRQAPGAKMNGKLTMHCPPSGLGKCQRLTARVMQRAASDEPIWSAATVTLTTSPVDPMSQRKPILPASSGSRPSAFS